MACVQAFVGQDAKALRGLAAQAGPIATTLAAYLDASAGRGPWSVFEEQVDDALAHPAALLDLQACLLHAAMARALMRGDLAVARSHGARLDGLLPSLRDQAVAAQVRIQAADLLVADGHWDRAIAAVERLIDEHPPGSDPWLMGGFRAAQWHSQHLRLDRAGVHLDRLDPWRERLRLLGTDLRALRFRWMATGCDYAGIRAQAASAAEAIGPGFVAAAAIEARRFTEARTWIARLQATETEDTLRSRILMALLYVAQGRARRARQMIAGLPADTRHPLANAINVTRLAYALAFREERAAATALHLLDPTDASNEMLPERIRLAMLRGDLPAAARMFRTLRELGAPALIEDLARRASELDGLAMTRLWMASDAVAASPAVQGRSIPPGPTLVGDSAEMRTLRTVIATCAGIGLPVLITGETGTGKEIVARQLHAQGCPPGAPFAALNCAALTDSLAEAELFGHVQGAFTGAVRDSGGLIGAAAGGVLFLDEINSLSLRLQGLLLRVLEAGEYRQVGSTTTRTAACRFVAATNQDLASACAAGTFRTDLRYRLERLRIQVPPLRDRREDIAPLCRHFAGILAGRPTDLDPAVLADFQARDWPGNVRELRNAVEGVLLQLPTAAPAPVRPIAARETAAPAPSGAPSAAMAQPHVPGTPAARSRRQRILALAARLWEVYPGDVATENGCNRKTAAIDLADLAAAGLLVRITRGGHGRVNPYRLPG